MATVNTNYVLKSNSSVDFTNTSQSLIYDDGTNIGISTASPASKLHVYVTANDDTNGHIKYENGSTSTGAATNAQLIGKSKYGTLQYMVWESYGARIGMRSTANSGAGDLYLTAGTDSTKMFIGSDGKVGIGTTAPGTTLEVNGAIRGGSFPNSTTNSGEAWVGRASDRTLGTYTIQLGGSSATGTTWEIVDRAWTKVIASISGEAPAASFTVTNTGVVYMNGGSVGIGTTNPSRKLHIRSTDDTRGILIQQTSTTSYAEAHFSASREYRIGTGHSSSDSSAANNFYIYDLTAAAHRFTVKSDGNVGIGTTNPAQLLTIGGGGKIAVYRSDNARAGLLYTDGDATYLESSPTGNDPLRLSSPGASGHVSIFTAGTEKVRVNGSGNIGIGTTNPGQKLEVAGIIVAKSSEEGGPYIYRDGNNAGDIRFYSYKGTFASPLAKDLDSLLGQIHFQGWDGAMLRAGASIFTAVDGAVSSGTLPGRIEFRTATSGDPSIRMVIKSDGNVGIGTTNPSGLIHAQSSTVNKELLVIRNTNTNSGGSVPIFMSSQAGNTTTNVSIENGGIGNMIFRTGNTSIAGYGTTRMFISSSGNIGIGIETPSYKLHVNGTMYSAGSSVMYKENIKSYDTTTDKIMALNPVTYYYKEEYAHLGKTLQSNFQIGLIAEEVMEVFPELAVLTEEEGQKVVRNVDYEKLSVILLTEVQKLRKELNQLKNH